jgi:hypothetical protein
MAQSLLQTYIGLAKEGTPAAIGEIMRNLNPEMSLAESKFIDFALGHVQGEEGMAVMERFLFSGTQIQRNYCALYFGRRGDYDIVRRAYDQGLIDAKQAFSR